MKPMTPFSVLLFFLSISPVQAESNVAAESLASIIETDAIENQSGIDGESLICISNDWLKLDARIHQLVKVEKDTLPFAFDEIESNKRKAHCFNPTKIPPNQRTAFDEIIERIEKLTHDQILLPVPKTTVEEIAESQKVYGLRNEDSKFGRKFLRAELLSTASQLISYNILLMMPTSETHWPENPLKNAGAGLKAAWTMPPRIDQDPFYVNLIGHPYQGSIYYNSMRSQGGSRLQSFIFSAIASTTWEYVIEATAERPSIQDLIITPVLGSALGELSHQATLKMRQNGFKPLEKIAVILINPTYVINNGFKPKKKQPIAAEKRR